MLVAAGRLQDTQGGNQKIQGCDRDYRLCTHQKVRVTRLVTRLLFVFLGFRFLVIKSFGCRLTSFLWLFLPLLWYLLLQIIKMYSMKPIHDGKEKLDLPSGIYNMKSIHSSGSNDPADQKVK